MEDKNRSVYRRNWYLDNKEKSNLQSKRNYERYILEKEGFLKERENKRLIKVYGISLEEYNILYEQQDYKCAICKKEETKTHHKSNTRFALCVDHNHKTGQVRGLLCSRCNRSMGLYYENPDLLQEVILYLNMENK